MAKCQVKPHNQGCCVDNIIFINPSPSLVEMKKLAEIYFHHFLGLASVTPPPLINYTLLCIKSHLSIPAVMDAKLAASE